MTQQLVLEPLGIVTEPNKLGHIPAGAMSSAVNCAIRSPGVIESRPTWAHRATIQSDAGTTAAFVITPPGPVMLAIFNRTAGWYYQWFVQSSGAFWAAAPLSFTLGGTAYPQSIPLDVQPGFSYVIHGKQLFVNMFSTVIVWDTYAPTTTAERTPRPAGLFPPQLRGTNGTDPGVALKLGTYAHYVAIYKRKVGDTLLVSAPSPAVSQDNTDRSPAGNVDVQVYFNALVQAGDILEVYRTPSKPAGPNVATAYHPGEEAGAEYRKVTAIVLTQAAIALGSISVTDSTPESSLGEALYTNQSVSGLGAMAFPPPALRFMTSHKGHLFGFGTTHPPSITLRPTGSWNRDFLTAEDAQSGFGEKTLTGCTWSAGGPPTVVTVSPTSQLGFVRLGMNAISGSDLNGRVTAIGASTITVNAAASAPGASTTCNVYDLFSIGNDFAFNTDWGFLPASYVDEGSLMFIAPALKLPPNRNVEFTSQPTDGFTIRSKLLSDARTTFTVKSSGEMNWEPKIAGIFDVSGTPATIENKPRQFVWSEQNQPESFPFVQNDTFARGLPCAFASTRDCIVAFYTDAIWVISGTGGSAKTGYDWRADPIITGVTVCGSQAVCVLNDIVYAMTSEGLIAIDGTAIKNISKGRVHDQLATPPWTDGPYTLSTACFLVADEERGEIIMREPSAADGCMWIYNVGTDTLVHTYANGGESVFHGDYSRTLRAPALVTKDSSEVWHIRTYSPTATASIDVAYQPVYADNPFSQRQWQSVDLSAEPTVAGSHFRILCNGVATAVGNAMRQLTNGRLSAEVPRNAPATGNTMAISVEVSGSAGHTRINGVALNYRDTTERRRKR
jgi:hypothetical protein